jgi:hypothetical protein
MTRTQQHPVASSLGRQGAAFGSDGPRPVVFGGNAQGGLLSDTWTFGGGAWTEWHPTGA